MDEILARAGIFQGVDPAAAAALTKQLQPADFPRGHTVFSEGEPGDRLYIILSGTVLLRGEDDRQERLVAGDHLICHPGDAHQIENDGNEPLVYYVISDHHPADVGTYTRTGKRWLSPERRVVVAEDTDYYAGEE